MHLPRVDEALMMALAKKAWSKWRRGSFVTMYGRLMGSLGSWNNAMLPRQHTGFQFQLDE